MMGRFGLELNLGKLNEKTSETLSKEIALYKTYQQDVHQDKLGCSKVCCACPMIPSARDRE